MILQNRLRAQADYVAVTVVKDYGDLPEVECYPGHLNQVFMNVLTNGIDALEPLRGSKDIPYAHRQPTLHIQTKALSTDRIGIYISDNGPGIPQEVQTRLFDPFFTTKDIGKGTGLGLAISYKIIVEKHGGELRCLSMAGQGAMFAIEIPRVQSHLSP